MQLTIASTKSLFFQEERVVKESKSIKDIEFSLWKWENLALSKNRTFSPAYDEDKRFC